MIPKCPQLQIVDDPPGISEWFTIGEHLVTYRDSADLQEKARYYLARDAERQRIAAAARAHALAHHRVEQRLARVEALLADI